jgi:hypothetical protein
MTIFWIAFVAATFWTLGRAQLRAEMADKAAQETKYRPTDTNSWREWNERGYQR